MLKKIVRSEVFRYLKEEYISDLVLYRGVPYDTIQPNEDQYSFFAKDVEFAKDYGDYIYKCFFKPINLFVSYEQKYIDELYANGYKLVDDYINMDWEYYRDEYDFAQLYDYDVNNPENNGYKSAKHFFKAPHSKSDTWETIEHSHGVLDYIISQYDGVVLVEGGMLT